MLLVATRLEFSRKPSPLVSQRSEVYGKICDDPIYIL